jgi:hypothetical protein
MKRVYSQGIIFLMILSCAGVVSAMNLVQNGGFEFPVLPSGTAFVNNSGNELPSWVTSGNSYPVRTLWKPSTGSQSLDLSGKQTHGSISQNITTPVKGLYELNFDIAGTTNCDTLLFRKLAVSWDGAEIGMFSFDTGGYTNTDMGWTHNRMDLPEPTGTSAKLTFSDISEGAPGCGVALDNVSVISSKPINFMAPPIPEFPGIILPVAFIVGLLGAVVFVERTKED